MSNFIHLHVHSHYSLLDGLPKIDEIINKAEEYNMPAVALTDHGVMYGIIEFFQKATKKNIKPIIGVEVYLAVNGLHQKRARIDERPYHLVLLAKDYEGYVNLIKITTKAHLEGFYYKPRIDFEYLTKHTKGLIGLSACLAGEIPRTILTDETAAKETIKKYQQAFNGDFYLEVQDNPSIPAQQTVNEAIFKLAPELGIDCIASNDVHYVNKDDAQAQEALLCIQMKKVLSDTNRMSMINEDWSFKSPTEMENAFKDHPEVISNTKKIAEQCDLEIPLGKTQLPYYKLPENVTPEDKLKKICISNLKKRYNINISSFNDPGDLNQQDKNVIERLEFELKIINKTGYASYFLIVQDFVNWAKEKNIVVGPGRGSVAGAIVAYLLNITNIDPLKYNLLFERFLNPDRISMPDIDMDFADTRRDEVIKHIENTYGKDHVAQIITFGTMAARAAIRDVGRVMDIPYTYCDKVAKMIPMFFSLKNALENTPEFKKLYEKEKDAKKMIDLAIKIEGAARHSSVHACGLVVTKDPLSIQIPVQYASADDQTIVSQYSLHPIEDLGLLKIDLLGLKNLTIIEHALYIIGKTTGTKININEISLNDKKTFELFRYGNTIGVFQFESSGMRKYLKELKPTDLEDIIAMVALYRPGPLNSGMVDEFIARKHGKKKVTYKHQIMENALKNTYGVIVYQEQVMQLSKDMAGFTGGQADTLRKAMGKKIATLMAKMKKDFVNGCIKNNLDKQLAESTFTDMEKFAEYGFNRSHAACYAMIAYQTAYLKANFPAQFMASLLTSDYGNLDRIAIEVEEARKNNIDILPPDVNESFSKFTVVADSLDTDKPRIRFGLEAIKNVGSEICRKIIDERKNNGKYEDIEDFLRRVQTKHLNKKSLDSLIKSGALDSMGTERGKLLKNMEQLLKYSKSIFDETASGQSNLFGITPTVTLSKLRLPETDPVDQKQMLAWEKELLGLFISGHPLSEHRKIINNYSIPFAELDIRVHTMVQTICIITKIKKIYTKQNEPMIFATVEDLSKEIEVIVFPKILQENPDLWLEDRTITICGKLSDKDGDLKIIVEQAKKFDKDKLNGLKKTQTYNNNKKIFIQVPEDASSDDFSRLKKLFDTHPGTNKIYLQINGKQLATSSRISLNQTIISEVENIIGKNCISIRHG